MTRTWTGKVLNDLLLTFYGVVHPHLTKEQQGEIVDCMNEKGHGIHNWDTIRCDPTFSPIFCFIVLLSCQAA
jgi:hypothetical protein